MRTLVTGSAGHLGEALMRTLRARGDDVVGLDIRESPYTDYVGSIVDPAFVLGCVEQVDAVLHTATLHKPHVGTHSRQDFVDTNITGTLNLLEASLQHDVKRFVFTSTTSTFGDAMKPAPGDPAVWVNESLRPRPKNIYGVTKIAAEDLCELFHRNTGLPCLVLKTSRFFAEEDDDVDARQAFDDDNLKVNELMYRRADIEDMVQAHLLALERAEEIGFARMIVSATPPFELSDAQALAVDAAAVVAQRVPGYEAVYAERGWHAPRTITRVYDNARACELLGWSPRYTIHDVVTALASGADYRSSLARQIGARGYHDETFEDGPYPVDRF